MVGYFGVGWREMAFELELAESHSLMRPRGVTWILFFFCATKMKGVRHEWH